MLPFLTFRYKHFNRMCCTEKLLGSIFTHFSSIVTQLLLASCTESILLHLKKKKNPMLKIPVLFLNLLLYFFFWRLLDKFLKSDDKALYCASHVIAILFLEDFLIELQLYKHKVLFLLTKWKPNHPKKTDETAEFKETVCRLKCVIFPPHWGQSV